jgi:protein-disulfide isomerase
VIEVDKKEFVEIEPPAPTDEDTAPKPAQETGGTEKSGVSPNPWLLLVIGLLVGGLAGFYLYPLVIPETVTAVGPLAAVEESAEINKPDPHQAVMLAVIAGARHFQGDENAPITLIEFGDFNCGYCQVGPRNFAAD